MIIAFMGNDGSGKSTISCQIQWALTHINALTDPPLKVEFRRGFDHFLLKYPLQLLGKKIENTRESFLDKKTKKKFYYWLFPFMVWVDCWIALLYFKFFKRKTILLFDRYVYDFLISWQWFGYNNRFISYLYKKFPKPDLAFIFDAPADLTYKRSKFDHKFPKQFYIEQRERYLDIAYELDIPVVSTDRSIKLVVDEVFEQIEQNING